MALSKPAEDVVNKFNDLVTAITLGGLQAPDLTNADPTAAGKVDLKWTYPIELQPGLTAFQIERIDPSGVVANLSVPDKTKRVFQDTGLVAGTTYRYRIRAVGSNRLSLLSKEKTATAK